MEKGGIEMDKDELIDEAKKVADSLSPSRHARVIALYGDLGSGKTTFTQAFAGALGISEHITSPTFVIEKRYRLNNQRFDFLIHIDAYRLNNPEELQRLNWEETLSNPKNIIVVEWADKVEELIPEDATNIKLSFLNEEKRILSYGK